MTPSRASGEIQRTTATRSCSESIQTALVPAPMAVEMEGRRGGGGGLADEKELEGGATGDVETEEE